MNNLSSLAGGLPHGRKLRLNSVALAVACIMVVDAHAAFATAAPQQNAAPTAAVRDDALRLSKLLNPSDKLIDVAMRGFEVGIDAALKKNPDDAKVFDENPGLLQAIVEAGKPIVRRHVEAAVPAHQQKFADFYSSKFSPDEIQQLAAFYSTPTGAKVIAGMYDGAEIGNLAEAIAQKPDRPLTPEAVREYTSSAGAKLLPGFDADDWKALFMFAATPAYAKLKSVSPEFRQLTADIANQEDPAMDAELDEAVQAAVGKDMEQKKATAKH